MEWEEAGGLTGGFITSFDRGYLMVCYSICSVWIHSVSLLKSRPKRTNQRIFSAFGGQA